MKEKYLLRREFIKLTSGGIAAMTVAPGCIRGTGGTGNMETDKKNDEIIFRSPWLKVAFPQNRPGISFLAVDSDGRGRLSKNLLMLPRGGDMGPFPTKASEIDFEVSHHKNKIEYRNIRLGVYETVDLVFEVYPQNLKVFIKRHIPLDYQTKEASPFRLLFDPSVTPPGIFGRLKERGELLFPVLLHFPDHGSLLVRAAGADHWKFSFGPRYQRLLGQEGIFKWMEQGYRDAPGEVQLSLMQGWQRDGGGIQKAGTQNIEMELTVTAIYPEKTVVDADPELEGVKRAWLNIFQFRPDIAILSNNVVSDNCGFCMYTYADQAYYTPPLFDDFLALDLIRTSMESYFNGAESYAAHFMDVTPSLIIAVWDYVSGTGNNEWLKQYYKGIDQYAISMLSADIDGDGLPEAETTGISGTGKDGRGPHSCNWYDVISFGWKDAYSTALHYRAFCCLEDMERRLGNTEKAQKYRDRAANIKRSYYDTFYNPETGVLAGWRSKDGALHDYYFTWVNGIAIAYGLIPDQQANQIMDNMQAKFREVGYNSYRFGLPGHLIHIPTKDMSGWPFIAKRGEDWQVYGNGGVSGNLVGHYIQALYHLGRDEEADVILEKMLEGYRDGSFQGGVNNDGFGNGLDWKRWDGSSCGYEGFLVDNYFPLNCLMTGRLKKGVPFPEDHP